MNNQRQPQPQKKGKRFIKMNRKAVENGFSTISLMILIPVFFLIAIFLLVFPRSTISQLEKRELATFPEFTFASYFDGSFTSGVTLFYDDTVPYHDEFKNVGNNFRNLFGFTAGAEETKIYGNPNKTPSKIEESSKTEPSTSVPSSEISTPSEQQSSEEESYRDYRGEYAEYSVENGIVVVKQDGHYRALELLGGGTGNAYAAALQQIKQDLGDSVTVYSMPAPLAGEYYLPSNYSDYSVSQNEYFNNLAEKLGDTIVSINICDILGKHQAEEIYCRTDHHWQPLGAYYAAQAFANVAGVPFAELTDKNYETVKNEGFVGTMYAFSKDANLLNDPETFTYYKPLNNYQTYYYDTSFNYEGTGNLLWKTDVANSYLVFMGGDEKVVKVQTDVKNGRKLLIIKDSYGNAEVPFYTASFEEIYVIDMRYFNCNLVDFVQQMGVTDVLFTMCSYSVYGVNADNLETLRTHHKGETIVDFALKKDDE